MNSTDSADRNWICDEHGSYSQINIGNGVRNYSNTTAGKVVYGHSSYTTLYYRGNDLGNGYTVSRWNNLLNALTLEMLHTYTTITLSGYDWPTYTFEEWATWFSNNTVASVSYDEGGHKLVFSGITYDISLSGLSPTVFTVESKIITQSDNELMFQPLN